MKLKAVIHPAEEGGFWAEVPAVQGCATQANTLEELMANLHQAVEACLSAEQAQQDETDYLLAAPENKARLLAAMQQVERNQLINVDLENL